jgi:hypothetical protein
MLNVVSEFWSSANAFYWISLIISSLIGFLFGYAANVLSGPHSARFKEWIAGGHLRGLLRLGGDEVIIVVPHQTAPSDRRLPQVAVEDVLALRNVFEILAELGIRHPRIRHPENLVEPDLKRNIISIGGSSRNSFTKAILELTVSGDVLAFTQSSIEPTQIELKRGNTMTYASPSYHGTPSDQPRARSKDVAFILRRPNPKNKSCSVIILAGIRGIGTWGASDHLRKHAKALAARVRRDQEGAAKHGFLAVVEAEYENFDIVQSRVKDITSVVG